MPVKFKYLAIARALSVSLSPKKLARFGPVLVFKHTLRVQLVRFTFHRDAGFNDMRIIESLRVFDRGTSKENQNAFETFNRLVNRDVPQRI